MPGDPETIVLDFVREGLTALGADPDPVFAAVADVPPADLDVEPRLWAGAAAATGLEHVGLHLARALESRAANALVYVAMSAANLEAALVNMVRFAGMVSQRAGRLSLRHQRGDLVVGFGAVGAPERIRHHTEFNAVLLLTLCRFVAGDDLVPAALRLRHRRPADSTFHREVFGVAPRFGTSRNALVLHAADAARPSRHADPAMLAVLEQHANAQLEALRDETLVRHVKVELDAVLERGPRDLEAVARRLGMSGRSLQRKLADHQTTFGELLDEVRRAKVMERIDQPAVPLGNIAFAAGFADHSSLYRAFKRWTGETPKQRRAKLA